MSESVIFLCGTAASVGVVHTLLGPDHYLPFLAMARARDWSLNKTALITFLCGVGHILSSVALGVVGIVFGVAVFRLESIEAFRGDIAGWLLLAFGLVYFAWGVRRAIRNKPHTHWHVHPNGTSHEHEHRHMNEHAHVHGPRPAPVSVAEVAGASKNSITPWVLFTIFVFGPCEPLIPILMYPAAKGNMWHVVLVTAVFGITTVATMLASVILAYFAVGTVTFRRMERYNHAMAGFVVFLCGVAVTAGL